MDEVFHILSFACLLSVVYLFLSPVSALDVQRLGMAIISSTEP